MAHGVTVIYWRRYHFFWHRSKNRITVFKRLQSLQTSNDFLHLWVIGFTQTKVIHNYITVVELLLVRLRSTNEVPFSYFDFNFGQVLTNQSPNLINNWFWQMQAQIKANVTRFGSRVLGRPTFWETCTSVVSHENMHS